MASKEWVAVRHRTRRTVGSLSLAAVLLAGCGEAPTEPRPVVAPNEGVQLSGQVGRAQLSVSDGDPAFSITDCDVDDGVDRDWCLVARSIDGSKVTLIIENPAIFVAGAELDVDFDRCRDCDDVTTGAIVDLIVDGTRRRAIDGAVKVVQAGDRYVLSFRLRFDDGGSISGECNVRPSGVIVPADASPSEG